MNANTDNPVLSIIVVTWNGKKYALECLESLRVHAPRVATEIIVVDNASSDGTPEAIRCQYPEVRLIDAGANLGFARGNNIGMAASRGKYVALVNSDVVLPAGCFEKIVAYMDAHADIGMLGPKMMSPEGGIGQSVMALPTVWNTLCCALGLHTVFPKSSLLGGFEMRGYGYNRIEDVEVLTGWFWVIPRKALEQVGGLDELYFIYGEDIDWSHRFLKAGWRVVFYPEAEALHYGAVSSGKAPTRFYVEMRRANVQYFRKFHSRPAVWAYKGAIWVHELVRVLCNGVAYCVRGKRRADAKAKIKRSLASMRWLMGDQTMLTTPKKVSPASSGTTA